VEISCSRPPLIPLFSLLAHTEAFEKTGILHCDISAGNIIFSDRGGLLIHRDISKDIKDSKDLSTAVPESKSYY
jgi:hypothetical protein